MLSIHAESVRIDFIVNMKWSESANVLWIRSVVSSLVNE